MQPPTSPRFPFDTWDAYLREELPQSVTDARDFIEAFEKLLRALCGPGAELKALKRRVEALMPSSTANNLPPNGQNRRRVYVRAT